MSCDDFDADESARRLGERMRNVMMREDATEEEGSQVFEDLLRGYSEVSGLNESEAAQDLTRQLFERMGERQRQEIFQSTVDSNPRLQEALRDDLWQPPPDQEENRAKAYYSDPKKILPKGTSVLVQNIKNPDKQHLNDRFFEVFSYEGRSKRYALVDGSAAEAEKGDVIGLFKRENMTYMTRQDFYQHRRNEAKAMAALYDPDGVHPIKKDKGDASPFVPLLKAMCPNVQRYKLKRNCQACGISPEELGTQLLFCNRCRTTPFCSEECLRRSWPTHKKSCTKRPQRMQQLRSRLALSHAESVRNLPDAVLETALDITNEFVDCAQVLIVAVGVQAGIGDMMPEECIINGIWHLCDIKLKPGDFLRVATAMGLGEELETGRKAKIAGFQQRERDMEKPREMALNVWRERLRPIVSRGKDDRDDAFVIGAVIGTAPGQSVLDMCDCLAERCEMVRLDEGILLSRFLLLLDELTRHIFIPGEEKLKDMIVLMRWKQVNDTIEKAKKEIWEAWEFWTRAYEGRDTGLDVEGSKSQQLFGIIRLELEQPHFMVGADGPEHISLDGSDINEWLAAEPGRWLPFDYSPGMAINSYLVLDPESTNIAMSTRDGKAPPGGEKSDGKCRLNRG